MSDRVSIGQAAEDEGIPLHVLISRMHRSGALLLEPGSDDPRCHVWMPGFESHGADCFCRFQVIHPDVKPLPEGC
jgi:hypothetical protein